MHNLSLLAHQIESIFHILSAIPWKKISPTVVYAHSNNDFLAFVENNVLIKLLYMLSKYGFISSYHPNGTSASKELCFYLKSLCKPIIRMSVVVVVELFSVIVRCTPPNILVTEINEGSFINHIVSCCVDHLIVSLTYVEENWDASKELQEFIRETQHVSNYMLNCFVGWKMDFRIKQDHIGSVCVHKFAEMLLEFPMKVYSPIIRSDVVMHCTLYTILIDPTWQKENQLLANSHHDYFALSNNELVLFNQSPVEKLYGSCIAVLASFGPRRSDDDSAMTMR